MSGLVKWTASWAYYDAGNSDNTPYSAASLYWSAVISQLIQRQAVGISLFLGDPGGCDTEYHAEVLWESQIYYLVTAVDDGETIHYASINNA